MWILICMPRCWQHRQLLSIPTSIWNICSWLSLSQCFGQLVGLCLFLSAQSICSDYSYTKVNAMTGCYSAPWLANHLRNSFDKLIDWLVFRRICIYFYLLQWKQKVVRPFTPIITIRSPRIEIHFSGPLKFHIYIHSMAFSFEFTLEVNSFVE